MRYVWTLDEINRMPEFGMDNGWYYGLVKNHENGKIRLCEIFPGYGYTDHVFAGWSRWERLRWMPRNIVWMIRDIGRTHENKSRRPSSAKRPRE